VQRDIQLLANQGVAVAHCIGANSKGTNVDTVFVNGRLLVRHGKLTGTSLQELRIGLDAAMGKFRSTVAGTKEMEPGQ
jgi:cytosine/adenosine deaminase-related metal-dependent hydrolase